MLILYYVWEQERLGNLCEQAKSRAVITDIKSRGKYDLYGVNGFIGKTNLTPINNGKKAILVVVDGSVGKTLILPPNSVFTSTLEALYIKEGFLIDFLFNSLKTEQLLKFSTGSIIKHLYFNEYRGINILVPNLKEQNKISIIFDNINSLITLHQRKLNALENLKKTLLEKMFPSENSVFPSIRFKEFTNAWEQERLGEIVDYFNGSSNEKEQTNEGKFEIVNLNSISISGELKPSGKFLHNAFETLKKGDIVMILSDIALGNLLGKSAVIPVDNRYVLNQRVALLRKNNSKFNSKFISLFLNKNQSLLFRKGAGSSQLNLSKKEVINFLIFSTSRNEQDKVSLIFNNINSLITLHQRGQFRRENEKKIRNFVL
ncbi:restriction endonuclease subunit S [Mycoplasmopsis cynos]|uniref:Restriction endonuclease subunit S n=1 Tax=Mycoplasmopsis cynos TaxID=171284 RepID=A0ABD8AJ55_9BACT|nr:restriction endonuclease subunit S [Mycoplasmopsis cynos]UWV80442.1 restriction endonuclease subunit S [Mycoplasmopsis cynos]UWV86419.1 restriction endonuclease subunit S [Mycoplasmopsis cynos]WAM05933.1 restriction endonuclease subunit S [Mycoplasmopsis cynos]WAM08809.1 restriction endonuclease subunit S [Mycoplasmopsis cynos]WQQ19816.1 restriction endonuclease subunit S [Mycoplasmopsis cynos]